MAAHHTFGSCARQSGWWFSGAIGAGRGRCGSSAGNERLPRLRVGSHTLRILTPPLEASQYLNISTAAHMTQPNTIRFPPVCASGRVVSPLTSHMTRSGGVVSQLFDNFRAFDRWLFLAPSLDSVFFFPNKMCLYACGEDGVGAEEVTVFWGLFWDEKRSLGETEERPFVCSRPTTGQQPQTPQTVVSTTAEPTPVQSCCYNAQGLYSQFCRVIVPFGETSFQLGFLFFPPLGPPQPVISPLCASHTTPRERDEIVQMCPKPI